MKSSDHMNNKELYLIKFLKTKDESKIDKSLFLSNDFCWTDDLSLSKKFDKNSALLEVGKLLIDHDTLSTIISLESLKDSIKPVCPPCFTMIIITNNKGELVRIFAEDEIYHDEIFLLLNEYELEKPNDSPFSAWKVSSYNYSRISKNISIINRD